MARMLSILATRVDFIGTTSYSKGNNRAIFSAIARLISGYDSAQSIQELMLLPEGVIWSKVTEGHEGLLVDRFHVGLQTGNSEPLLMMPVSAISSMLQEVTQRFGSGGEMILYNQGKAYSLARFAAIKRGLGPNPETRLEEIAAMTCAAGWAIVKAKLEPGGNAIEFNNFECFECSTSKSRRSSCSFLRGMAAGLVEALFRKEVTSEETKCKGRGDEACTFIVKPRDGSPLGGALSLNRSAKVGKIEESEGTVN